MPNGEIIKLKEAQTLIGNYIHFVDELKDLASRANPQNDASKFLTQLTDHNAYIIDSLTLKRLKKAKFCIVFLAKEEDGSPTIVVANCNSDDMKKFTVPSETIAALEHIPPTTIPTIEKGLAGKDNLFFELK